MANIKALFYNFFPTKEEETQPWRRIVSSKVVDIIDYGPDFPKLHNLFPTKADEELATPCEELTVIFVAYDQSPITRNQDDLWKIKKTLTDNETSLSVSVNNKDLLDL
ncbi:hypothetical protein Droror1_Dr00019406 [Drosera rotundifolia]